MVKPNLFVNIDSGALAKVEKVDAGYAELHILSPNEAHYNMPIAEYDTKFISMWRPATAEDLVSEDDGTFRLPLNAPDGWVPQTS